MQIRSIRDLAATVRGRRLALGLSQAELGTRAGVSRQWVNEFEKGKATAELGLTLRLVDVLGLGIDLFERSPDRSRATDGELDLDAVLRDYMQQ